MWEKDRTVRSNLEGLSDLFRLNGREGVGAGGGGKKVAWEVVPFLGVIRRKTGPGEFCFLCFRFLFDAGIYLD